MPLKWLVVESFSDTSICYVHSGIQYRLSVSGKIENDISCNAGENALNLAFFRRIQFKGLESLFTSTRYC